MRRVGDATPYARTVSSFTTVSLAAPYDMFISAKAHLPLGP